MLPQTQMRCTFLTSSIMVAGWLFVIGLYSPLAAQAVNSGVVPDSSAAAPEQSDGAPVLDNKHLYALGMIETGNDDRVVGAAGEVSRYQLSPIVWKSYSKSVEYQNPDVSLQVARQHWNHLVSYFKDKAGRLPTDFDMYVLWNTRFGYYSHHHFAQEQLSIAVRDRAQRFVNLINRKD